MKKEEKQYYGGQALIEGVMMRGKHNFCIAIRKADGSIKLINDKLKTITDKYKIFQTPFIRGIIVLWENLIIGTKALIISANEALPDEEKEEKSQKLGGFSVFMSVAIAILLGFGLFVALPNIIFELIGINPITDVILYNTVAGITRIIMFILYVMLISLMKDVRRLFMYHGAEHRAINSYEKEEELIPENVQKHTTYHPRCGTSFMFFVLLVAIFMGVLLTVGLTFFDWFSALSHSDNWLNRVYRQAVLIPAHLALLPLIAGISYELIKFSFRMQNNPIVQLLALPGKWIQKITTKAPTDDMAEVAIAALKSAIEEANIIIADKNEAESDTKVDNLSNNAVEGKMATS